MINYVKLLAFICFIPATFFGQSFRFHQYTMEDGISQNFIYSVQQDENGYLWVCTGEGLCKFDGKSFITYTTKDGLAEDIITQSFKSDNGDMWFGHNQGKLTKYSNGKFTITEPVENSLSTINGICQSNDELFYITQNDGLFSVREDKIYFHGKFNQDGFYSIETLDQNNIILGTSNGLIHLKKNGTKWKKQLTYLKDKWVTSICKSHVENVYLVGLQNGGLKRVRLSNDKLQFSNWDDSYSLSEIGIKTIIEDNDKNIWLGTYGQGMIKLHVDSVGMANTQVTRYNSSTGLSSDFVQTIYQDREGNIWIGTFGAGLSTLIDDFFTFYSHDPEKFGNSVYSIWVDSENKWYGVENGLIRISSLLEKKWMFYNDSTGLITDKITSLYQSDSILWIGTNGSGLYSINVNSGEIFKPKWELGNLESTINQLTSDGQYIYAATNGGVVLYEPNTQNILLFNTEAGLSHNTINSVHCDDNSTVWVGGHSRNIYSIYQGQIESYQLTNTGELDIVSITNDPSGDLWIATSEMGVYKYENDVFRNFKTGNGLKSNYTYAVQYDGNGNIWVGHRGGLSKLNIETEKIIVFDRHSGIKSQISNNGMFLDEQGYLWIGTDNGAIKYDPSKDKKNSVAPKSNLTKIVIGDKAYPIDQDIHLPYGNYRMEFEFVGVSFKHPDKVTYAYQLEGYDEIYSTPSTQGYVTYGRISDGEYILKVIAYNEDGFASKNPALIRIVVASPIWKKWWFYVIILLFISLIVLFLFRIRIKRLKENQIYLENQLALKTKEVVEKAERIKEINLDLTSSITYAKRIQRSVLPDVSILQTALPDSFIFFKPRDIVSGDFFYLEQIGNKLIVACVDCTGHGVPGAIMSMVGSVTLHNIYSTSNYKWKTPDQVLEKLDEEVTTILHQKEISSFNSVDSLFQAKDGMDLTLCEINLDTKEVLLASAMRNSLLVSGGEMTTIQGDKRPIGGGDNRGINFSLQKFKMSEGDELYIYSDGYPDQFGGERGRKLKMSGTKNIIQELQSLNKEDYLNHIQNSFDKWQGEFDQTDDVLFMGLMF